MAKIFYQLRQNKNEKASIYGKWFAHSKAVETMDTRKLFLYGENITRMLCLVIADLTSLTTMSSTLNHSSYCIMPPYITH